MSQNPTRESTRTQVDSGIDQCESLATLGTVLANSGKVDFLLKKSTDDVLSGSRLDMKPKGLVVVATVLVRSFYVRREIL